MGKIQTYEMARVSINGVELEGVTRIEYSTPGEDVPAHVSTDDVDMVLARALFRVRMQDVALDRAEGRVDQVERVLAAMWARDVKAREECVSEAMAIDAARQTEYGFADGLDETDPHGPDAEWRTDWIGCPEPPVKPTSDTMPVGRTEGTYEVSLDVSNVQAPPADDVVRARLLVESDDGVPLPRGVAKPLSCANSAGSFTATWHEDDLRDLRGCVAVGVELYHGGMVLGRNAFGHDKMTIGDGISLTAALTEEQMYVMCSGRQGVVAPDMWRLVTLSDPLLRRMAEEDLEATSLLFNRRDLPAGGCTIRGLHAYAADPSVLWLGPGAVAAAHRYGIAWAPDPRHPLPGQVRDACCRLGAKARIPERLVPSNVTRVLVDGRLFDVCGGQDFRV